MDRLRRLDWTFDENPVYFVTACTHQRARILANDAVHEVFKAFCGNSRQHGVLVGKYVLMPDHLHVFVCVLPGSKGLSSWVKSLKNSLSKHWRESEIHAPHWQKGYFDHLLRSTESSAEKWKYVHENPVRARLCDEAGQWPYTGQIMPAAWL